MDARTLVGTLVLVMTGCAAREPGAPRGSPPPNAPVRASWPSSTALVQACRGAPPEPAVPAWKPGERYLADLVLYTAHPDDESMYAGGTISRIAARGRKVAIVIASHGEGGRLLEPLADGGFEERRDFPLEHVVKVRDDETLLAVKALGAELVYLHPGAARLDYAFTKSCEEAMSTWDKTVPGGASGILARMVEDLRKRQARVVVTLDRRDDPGGSLHGHHRAAGVLAELAARFAATGIAPELGAPFAIEELLVLAPKDVPADVTVTVDPAARRRALAAYASQFKPEDVSGFGSRPNEGFVLVWRARGAPTPKSRTRLAELVE